jgi:EAL domain-containing protein (putative c-di-GMP-specific phosphodiesterase class I)
MEQKTDQESLWRERIETALEGSHFLFFGQPVVDFRTNVIHHYELLLRMEVDDEIVTPNHFLPHAENCDLISRIDRWVVRMGIETAESVPVSINLSAKSLGDADLIANIGRQLEHSRVSPESVVFEITETMAVEDLEAAGELVRSLTCLGCDVSLDDFGTRSGSFTYLKYLPVRELKIDIRFIRDLAKDANDRRLVRSMVDAAEKFGIRTVAEGIEDDETLDIVRELNVGLAQGYHVGYPARMRGVPHRTAPYELPSRATRSLLANGG